MSFFQKSMSCEEMGMHTSRKDQKTPEAGKVLKCILDMWSCRHLDLDFWLPEPWDKNFLLFWATLLVVLCYACPMKLIHNQRVFNAKLALDHLRRKCIGQSWSQPKDIIVKSTTQQFLSSSLGTQILEKEKCRHRIPS